MGNDVESPAENNSGESCNTEETNLQPKLADVKFPETPEDQKEQPKSLKKKNSDRQNRRDRESQTSGDTSRQSTSSYRSSLKPELHIKAPVLVLQCSCLKRGL